jgi:asparagine synthase (glutamine-hydrolysing)
MCGITAIWATQSNFDLEGSIRAATATLMHRGPDDGGIWMDRSAGLALGHRRLAILDLSPAGHQPMISSDGRYSLTFNGEIYNFQSIRLKLEALGHRFCGQSDTEVMLAAFLQWGVERALQDFVGMFAFALWDQRERRLTLARDRVGKKPLYFGWLGNCFAVASELKALRAITGFGNPISALAVDHFTALGYVPTPLCIYEHVYKLPAGSILEIDIASATRPSTQGEWQPRCKSFWNPSGVVEQNVDHRFQGSEERAVSTLTDLLTDAVRIRMIADVPLGAFLSGGIDSSLVVALMQRISEQRVKTFTIGYADAAYDESAAALWTAKHLGTDHHAIMLTAADCLQTIPRLASVYDEPFADPSQIPMLLMSNHARKTVSVVLSGDGGDELFGGYNRHVWLPKIWRKTAWLPAPLRFAIAGAIRSLSPAASSDALRLLSSLSGQHGGHRLPGDKMSKIACVLSSRDFQHAYASLARLSRTPSGGRDEISIRAWEHAGGTLPRGLLDIEQLMYLDMTTYLIDDVLVKVDRATMAYGLEARAPLLDHRVIEFAWSLPQAMKVRDGVGKRILRRLRDELLPPNPLDNRKMGFAVPIDDWLRGPLREWADGLLSAQRLRSDGYFNARAVAKKWQAHVRRRASHHQELWAVLMFNAWLDAGKPT